MCSEQDIAIYLVEIGKRFVSVHRRQGSKPKAKAMARQRVRTGSRSVVVTRPLAQFKLKPATTLLIALSPVATYQRGTESAPPDSPKELDWSGR